MNTETPGSVIDRLAILHLRIHHLWEEHTRQLGKTQNERSIADKLAICQQQELELATALSELFADLLSGRKRHRTYRQCKMYNDPLLNPQIYRVQSPRAA